MPSAIATVKEIERVCILILRVEKNMFVCVCVCEREREREREKESTPVGKSAFTHEVGQ